MRSQFIDRRTQSERAVAVEICERGPGICAAISDPLDTTPADIDGVEGVRASGPLHEHRRRRRPGVLDVEELAILIAHDKVQVACERHKTCGRSLSIDGLGLSVPSPSISPSAGVLSSPTSMASKGFALPVLSTNAGAVDVPVFSA